MINWFVLVITWLWGWFGIYHQSYFLSILKSSRASARVILKLIKNNKSDISQISRTAMWFPINHIFTDKHHTITSTTSNQRGDYKTEGDYKRAGWLQNKQLTSPVRLHKEMWLKQYNKSFSWEKREILQQLKLILSFETTNS